MEVVVPGSTYGQPLHVLVDPWADLLSASQGLTLVLKWVDIVRSLAGWFGGHDICWRLPGGDPTMKELYLKTILHVLVHVCFTLILICLANFGSSMCWWQQVSAWVANFSNMCWWQQVSAWVSSHVFTAQPWPIQLEAVANVENDWWFFGLMLSNMKKRSLSIYH